MITIELNIIQEYKIITEKIAVAKSQLTTARRDLQKNMDTYRPSDAKGIDYSKERVQASMQQQDIMVTANNICILTEYIRELENELKELYDQRKELEDTINSLGDVTKQYVMYKIKEPKMPNWKIAQKAHVSLRTLERSIRELKVIK